MSSSTSISRTRSLRRPTGGGELSSNSSTAKPTADAAPRNTSPSRLPVKPPTSSTLAASRAASSSASSYSTAPAPAPKTKTSIFNRLASTTTRSAPQNENVRPSGTAATISSSATSTTARPKTSGGLPPPQAGSSIAAPRTTRAMAHARSKSSATALTDATVLRPPSATSLASNATATSATTTTTTTTTSRPPLTAMHPKLLHRRAPSNPIPSKQSSSQPAPITSQQHQQQQPPPRGAVLRPAFNTMQQHYSPLKSLAPKPTMSTYLAPPSPSKLPANVALSAETARLQTELLQLHLLHRDAAATTRAWHASARARLSGRFAAVAEAGAAVARGEGRRDEGVNAGALRAWGGNRQSSRVLEERTQVLDAVLCGLWAISEPGGRHARVVRRFEKWAVGLGAVVERREELMMMAGNDDDDDHRRIGGHRGKGGRHGDGEEIIFVAELGGAWRDECAALARKLDGWRRALRDLGNAPDDDGFDDHYEGDGSGDDDHVGMLSSHGEDEGPTGGQDRRRRRRQQQQQSQISSLGRILRGCRVLVHDMLAELNLMEQIEREALRQESEWVESTNREGEGGDDTPRAGAIWRVM